MIDFSFQNADCLFKAFVPPYRSYNDVLIQACPHDPKFWSQLLLKLEEDSDTNQHSYELKQCKNNKWIPKHGLCEPTQCKL